MAPKVLRLDLNEPGLDEKDRVYPVLDFKLRPLTDKEWAEAGELYRKTAGVPPELPTKPGDPQRYNERDPAYQARLEEAIMLQRGFALQKALVDMELAGSPADVCKRLRDSIPPRIFDALFAAVRVMTDEPVKLANFI